jgi:hypothetical protein
METGEFWNTFARLKSRKCDPVDQSNEMILILMARLMKNIGKWAGRTSAIGHSALLAGLSRSRRSYIGQEA